MPLLSVNHFPFFVFLFFVRFNRLTHWVNPSPFKCSVLVNYIEQLMFKKNVDQCSELYVWHNLRGMSFKLRIDYYLPTNLYLKMEN